MGEQRSGLIHRASGRRTGISTAGALALKDLPRPARPREKLWARSPAVLTDAELLALILGSGIRGTNALTLAGDLLARWGDGLMAAPVHMLARQTGIGPARACQVAAAVELGRRWFGRTPEPGPAIAGPEDAARLVQDLVGARREHVVALYLNVRHCVVARETVAIGTLTESLVHPREVFAPALAHAAAAVILAHNHPSGDPTPSDQDRRLTERLSDAGALLGIPLLDHVVVARNGWRSLKEFA